MKPQRWIGCSVGRINAVSPPDFDIEQGLLDPPSDRKSLWYRLLNQRAFAMK